MAERGVIIPIGGDASGLDAAIDRAVSSLRSLASSASSAASGGVRQLQQATSSAGASMRRGAVDVERYKDATYALNKAANATGGTLTFLTGPLEDVGDLLERGGVRMAAMTVGLVAGAGALYSLGSAAVAAAGALVDTVKNASELLDTLEEGGRTVLPAHRDALLEAQAATRGLDAEHSRLTLTLSAMASGPLTKISDAMSFITASFIDASNSVRGFGLEIQIQTAIAYPRMYALAAAIGYAVDTVASYGRALRGQADAQAATIAANEAWMAGLAAYLDTEAEVVTTTDAATGAIHRQATALRAVAEEAINMPALSFDLSVMFSEDANRAAQEGARANADFAASYGDVSEALFITDAQVKQNNKSVSELTQQWAEHYDRVTRQTQQFAADFAYYSAAGFNIARGFNELTTQSSRKEARRRAAINKAEALVNAGVNTAVAVTKALASAAPPVNIILAALVGALGAVQIGLIAAKPVNTFHRGGLLPDEERLSATSTVVRRNESVGIVTGGGTAAAQRAVSRLNAGEVTSGDTYLLVEGDVFRTRRVAGPNPRYGRGR